MRTRIFCPPPTNPTLPYTVNTIDEHLDDNALMASATTLGRYRRGCGFCRIAYSQETIAAEDVLHDIGAFSPSPSSDSQAMGRVGE